MFSLLILATSFGQSVHAFLFCKTNDPDIGQSVKYNYANSRELFQSISSSLNYNYIEHSFTGSYFKSSTILEAIDNVNLNPDDIVLVLFSTHGARSGYDSNIFPQLDIPNDLISAYKQHQKLINKGPKFILTIVEACNGYQDITPQESFLYEQSNSTIQSDNYTSLQVNNIKKLFQEDIDCNIIITAGQPGKNTWATPNGSMFINCFLRAFNEIISEGTQSTWDNVLKRAKQYTFDMTGTTTIQYYPVWEVQTCEKDVINRNDNDDDVIDDDGEIQFSCSQGRYDNVQNRQFYEISLTIQGSKPISKVIYFLHYTMNEPVVEKYNENENFLYKMNVWGYYLVKAKVYYENGKVVELYKTFNFDNCD